MTSKDKGKFDHKREIEWIPVKNICTVWVQAQRPYDAKHAREIADNLDPDKFGTLSVSLPNGKGIYHNIDGQHRRGAVEMLWGPNELVPCEVFHASDPARAAELFDAINGSRKSPQPIDRFLVRVTANKPEEVAVSSIVHAAGYTICSSKHQKSISCVAALLSIYRNFGTETLEKTLKILQATWGLDPQAVVAPIMRGYGMFMANHGRQANWQRVKECMAKKYTPGRLIGAAKSAREMSGGSIPNSICALIVANYNRGLPTNKHLKPIAEGRRGVQGKEDGT